VRNRTTIAAVSNETPTTNPPTDVRPAWRAEAERQGVDLVWIAERTGISTRAIYAYSTGQRQPSPEWLERVTSLLARISEAWA
jgi:hypothetical protein